MAISLFAAPILALSVQSSTFNVLHTCAGIGCLCVCQPLDQGFTATDFLLFPPVFHPERNFHQQGHTASMTYRVQRSCGHGWEGKADHLPVPAFNTLTPMVHPAAVRCFHGPSSCYCPSNLGLSATCSRRGVCSTPPQSRDKLLC